MNTKILLGILLPFIGTTLGSLLVFFIKNKINKNLEKILLGFSGGVMIAASIWSLIIPSVESSNNLGKLAFIPAVIGLLLGNFFLIKIDKITNKINNKKDTLLMTAVTIHNIPEGMAVGVIFASLLNHNSGISLTMAYTLALGIAIQNIPEGAIISLPLKCNGKSKKEAFKIGVLSGIVEPIAAFITLLLTNIITPILPYLLSFAAGTMIYVVIKELLPDVSLEKNNNIGINSFFIGFIIMMILDITLG